MVRETKKNIRYYIEPIEEWDEEEFILYIFEEDEMSSEEMEEEEWKEWKEWEADFLCKEEDWDSNF
jgi:hypothetical protein